MVEVAAVVETISGTLLNELEPRDLKETVWDIKSNSVEKALAAEERQIVLHGTEVCDDSANLSSCICPLSNSAEGPLRLTFVITAEVPVVRVPGECSSLTGQAFLHWRCH